MQLKAYTISLLLSIANLSSAAQYRLTIDAPDSLAFLLHINGTPINYLPIVSVSLHGALAGKTNLKVEFPEQSVLNFSQIVTIKKGSSVTYSIDRSKGALKFILTSESILTFDAALATTEENILQTTNTVADHIEHNGCHPLVDELLYQEMIAMVDAQHFESKKLIVMTDFATTSCMSTDQLRYMMSKLSQEDNKLALLMAAGHNIHDRNNLPEVSNDFFLARNKSKAIEIIATER